jgi:drug/metabolite transporter (DMT)-like permease
MYIADMKPPRFCLYFIGVKAVLTLGNFLLVAYLSAEGKPSPFAPEVRQFMFCGLLAGALDAAGWVLYFESLLGGPVSIVGTVSAAYAVVTALEARIFLDEGTVSAAYAVVTALEARIFLDEYLSPIQYLGVMLVIGGCIGIAYEPSGRNREKSASSEKARRRILGMPLWFIQAVLADFCWGSGATLQDYFYMLPRADDVTSESNLMLYMMLSSVLVLGGYGWIRDEQKGCPAKEVAHATPPAAMFVIGDLAAIVAYGMGTATLVTTLSGAYPAVTLLFAYLHPALRERPTGLQWFCIVLIFIGMLIAP